ncbi:unnamed protein product [Litomosoides sigmodontis]|uniref:ShKT domain-containing protein n=1 Tax=Litomosoides sigmodontis TaxID=42156 RepID=A0A3P6T8I3_LITSI|nr:unnamed protein product [Litomosoides sigmodontis]
MAKIFPALPRTGQVIDPAPSSFSPISFHQSQQEENFKKIEKIGERQDRLARIAGNAKKSSPMFVKLINKSLSTGRAVDEHVHVAQLNSDTGGGWQLDKRNRLHSRVPEIQLKRNMDEAMDRENKTFRAKKPGATGASCIYSKKQKHVVFNEYFRSWNFSLEPADLSRHSLDILDMSVISRKCSTDQKSAFCCQEVARRAENFTSEKANSCNAPEQSTKCHEFCININPENGHFINSTKYPCREGNKSSISTFVDWVQTIVYNKTSAIIFGQNESVRNRDFQTWARQMLQNLDVALALSNHNSTTMFAEGEVSNAVLLSQWMEFPKSNETSAGEEIAWQLLKEYERHDENVFNSLIRICTTNQDMAQIVCTEQYFQNLCHSEHPDECVDGSFSAQQSVICRQFTIEDEKVVEITELLCDSLNESVIFWDYQREASESATGVLILHLTRTTVIHSIPAAAAAAAAAAIQLDGQGKAESSKEKRGKYATARKLRSEGEVETNTHEKTVKAPLSELPNTAVNSEAFTETDHMFTTIDSILMQTTFNQTDEAGVTLAESLSEVNIIATLAIPSTDTTNLTDPLKIKQDIDALNTTTVNANDMNKINAGNVGIEIHTIDDSANKPVAKSNYMTNNLSKRNKQSLWKPFHMDCGIEKDEFNVSNCSNWAAAGYCLSNNATRFLWCRKTCLCVGPPRL